MYYLSTTWFFVSCCWHRGTPHASSAIHHPSSITVTHHPASMRSVSMPIANDDQETFKDIRPTNVGIHALKSEKGTSSTPAKAETMTRVST